MRTLLAAIVLALLCSVSAEAKVIHRGVILDPKGLVRTELIVAALAHLKGSGLRKDRIAVVDFSKHSSRKRFYVIDLRTGRVQSYRTSHGKGSDANHDGIADNFSDQPHSNASSLGAYATGSAYVGKYGLALRLNGLDDTNRHAASRAIVLHSAPYSSPSWLQQHGQLGRSFGCFVVDPKLVRQVVNTLRGGVLIYAGK